MYCLSPFFSCSVVSCIHFLQVLIECLFSICLLLSQIWKTNLVENWSIDFKLLKENFQQMLCEWSQSLRREQVWKSLSALNEIICTHNSLSLQSQLPVDRSMWWQRRLMVDSVVLTEITSSWYCFCNDKCASLIYVGFWLQY